MSFFLYTLKDLKTDEIYTSVTEEREARSRLYNLLTRISHQYKGIQ